MKISIDILLFSISIFCVASSASAANPVAEYFTGLKTFRVQFVQTEYGEDFTQSAAKHGVLIIQSPDKFHLEYSKPYKQLYIADGKRIWSYDEDLEQVIVKSQKDILANTPAMILSRPQDIEKNYTVESLGLKNKMARFKLVPKNSNANFTTIILGFINTDFRLMLLSDSFGQQTRLVFDKTEKNPQLDASLFKFIPPKDVDIITENAAQ